MAASGVMWGRSESRAGAECLHVVVDAEARNRGVLVAFSDRGGGVSGSPFESLNLAVLVGDRPADVMENRRRVAAAAGFQVGALHLFRQAHGKQIRTIAPSTP